ncbi:MAG: hypothetical protein ACKOYK_10230 [Cyanobium sp.]
MGLDQLALIQAIGGFALGLIALFSSDDHITFAGRSLHLQQQWGIPFIVASVAIVFIDAELATGSRLRAAQDAARAADGTARDRFLQAESDILRVRKDSERIAQETKQIERDTEQLRQENAKLRRLNAKTQCLLSCVDRLCFPPDSSSSLLSSTGPIANLPRLDQRGPPTRRGGLGRSG